MSSSTLIAGPLAKMGQAELVQIPVPAATQTHKPVPHHKIIEALVETLGFRHIGVVHDEYAVSPDGMKMFGVVDLATEMEGCRFHADVGITGLRLGFGTLTTSDSGWHAQSAFACSCVTT